MLRCPRCQGENTRRSARRGIERAVSVLGLFPFRCEDCDARFLRFTLGERETTRSDFHRDPQHGKT
jgi:transposase-like protein